MAWTIHHHITARFLTSGRTKILDKRIWAIRDVTNTYRLAIIAYSHSHSLHHSLSLRSGLLISYPSLYSLLKSCSSPSRRSLTSMVTPQAATDSPQSPSIKTVRAVIKGRVQGVFYRNWTIENATQLGLKGWVRNRRDGSVEALFSGNPDAVQEMEQRCRRGPPDAMVTGLEVHGMLLTIEDAAQYM